MDAQRVPPSAWMTSQSMVIWRSPSASRSTTARSARPIRRWISLERPSSLSDWMSRFLRVLVERGSIAYSAVTQPRPLPSRKGGTFSSTDAVQMTLVLPISASTEPSAYMVNPVVSLTGRISSFALPSGLVIPAPLLLLHFRCHLSSALPAAGWPRGTPRGRSRSDRRCPRRRRRA